MTEQERNEIIKLWENGLPSTAIQRMFPYRPYTILKEIKQMRKDGLLVGNSGKTSAKTIQKAIELYKEGKMPHEVAEQLKISISYARKLSVDAKLNRHCKGGYKKAKIKATTTAILQDLEQGLTQSECARKYGVSRQWVNQIKKWGESR